MKKAKCGRNREQQHSVKGANDKSKLWASYYWVEKQGRRKKGILQQGGTSCAILQAGLRGLGRGPNPGEKRSESKNN